MLSLNAAILLLLTLHRSGSSILLHEAGHGYSTGLAVLLGEFFKQAICSIIGIHQLRAEVKLRLPLHKAPVKDRISFFFREIREATVMFWKKAFNVQAWGFLLPAALYVAQNNLFLYASGRLRPSTFQSLWQAKLIPTAIFSQMLLGKELDMYQWFSLSLILGGVLLAQNRQEEAMITVVAESFSSDTKSYMIAVAALLIAALLASFAGVYLESSFKHKDTNLWIANYQLSTFSIAPAVIFVMIEVVQADDIAEPFRTFFRSFWAWNTVFIHGVAGILVALATKHAGCIAGNISGISSIAITHIIQLLRGAIHPQTSEEISFFGGFTLIAVGVAIYIYLSTSKLAKHPESQVMLSTSRIDKREDALALSDKGVPLTYTLVSRSDNELAAGAQDEIGPVSLSPSNVSR